MIDIEAAVQEPVMRFLEFDLDDVDDEEDQIIDIGAVVEQPPAIVETITNTTNTNNTLTNSNSNLYLSNEGKGGDDKNKECDRVPAPASLLLKAADIFRSICAFRQYHLLFESHCHQQERTTYSHLISPLFS